MADEQGFRADEAESRPDGTDRAGDSNQVSADELTQQDFARASRLGAAPANGDDVVAEYERRYRPEPDVEFATEKPKRGPARPASDAWSSVVREARRREVPLSYSTTGLTREERQWAAVAEVSIWATLLVGILTGGTFVPVTIFAPLVIYFMYRQKSDFVAFHAMQAFVLQLIATVGVLALLLVGGILWGIGLILAALSLLVLIGLVLLPVWLLIGVAFFAICAVMPFGAGVLGAIAAVEVYNGRDYHYPFISRWIDRQLAGNYVRAV
jgi:hypothetical protein